MLVRLVPEHYSRQNDPPQLIGGSSGLCDLSSRTFLSLAVAVQQEKRPDSCGSTSSRRLTLEVPSGLG